jgi:hypothetical protein
MASKERLIELGSMIQWEIKVNRNQPKPIPNKTVAILLLNADLWLAKDNITWKMTQRKAICHRLFSTAQPKACRKLELPIGILLIFKSIQYSLNFVQFFRARFVFATAKRLYHQLCRGSAKQ